MSSPVIAHPLAARRFVRRALGLDAPFASLGAALEHLGYVQIDPINVCGRMHDLILRPRVAGYRQGDLMRYLHGEPDAPVAGETAVAPGRRLVAEARRAFEHHLPDRVKDTGVLVAFPLDAWPHLLAAMQTRARRPSAWSGRLTPRERELAPQLLAEIAARGPLSSQDFDDRRRAHRVVWGAASLVKSTLQKLFFHGRLLIAGRMNNRRRYDLPERVLPAAVLGQTTPPAADTTRWLAQLKLRQRRLVTLKRDEARAVDDIIQPVAIAGADCPPLFCLRDDRALLEAAMIEPAPLAGDAAAPPVTLLAPLDPVIYDRRVTACLWAFDYTWEAYTPAHKRVRGHYALPVLVGTEIVGHVDPWLDRAAGKLLVVSRKIRRGYAVAPALRSFADWLLAE